MVQKSKNILSTKEQPAVETEAITDFARVMEASAALSPRSSNELNGGRARIHLDPDKVKNGLGQLVLTLVKLLHELLERQAIRRIESGSLSDDEIERVGVTLMGQAEEIERLRKEFNLDEEDLNLDLGPLGKLL
jgi:Gas vesicle protein K